MKLSPSTVGPRVLWWLLVAGWGGALACFALRPDWFRVTGVNHLGIWFLDIQAILASCDAQAAGLDPYAANPLDVLNRPHVYAHWWLVLGRLGFTRADAPMLGFLLGGAFVVTVLFSLRPREPGEQVWFLVALCSPPMFLALDRANNDLVVFILLAPVVPCLLSERAWVRLLPVPLLVAAVALKAYPLVAGLLLLAGHGPRDTRRLVFAGALLLAVALPDIVTDFRHYSHNVPDAEGLTTIGARNLFAGLGLSAPTARWLGMLGGAAIAAAFWRGKLFEGWTVAPADRAAWLGFVLGAVLLAGCFFAGTSYAYRWIYALWLLPLLWRLPADQAVPRKVRCFAAVTAVLLLIALWADGLFSGVLTQAATSMSRERTEQVADRFFFIEQPLAWACFACLVGFLTHFAREGLRVFFSAEPPPSPSVR